MDTRGTLDEGAAPTIPRSTGDQARIEAMSLQCPVCQYDVSGLPENVCPECGTAFDPAQLRQPRRSRDFIQRLVVIFVVVLNGIFMARYWLAPPARDPALTWFLWMAAVVGALSVRRTSRGMRHLGGLYLLLPLASLSSFLSPVPDVAWWWPAYAIAAGVGAAMLMRPSQRSWIAAMMFGAAATCLMLGLRYLAADLLGWMRGSYWSATFSVTTIGDVRPGRAGEFVLLGCVLTGLGTLCIAGGIFVRCRQTDRRKRRSC